MDLCIWPGRTTIYRLVMVDPDGRYQTLSEHDDPYHAKAAALIAQAAKDRADLLLNKIFRETVR